MAALCAAFVVGGTPASAERGVSDEEIVIGQSADLSGPSSTLCARSRRRTRVVIACAGVEVRNVVSR
jgi:hypothetical protein